MSNSCNQLASTQTGDGYLRRLDEADQARIGSEEVASLTTAVEAMCNDFGQQSQRQRTLSWVSSNEASSIGGQHRDSEETRADRDSTLGVSRRQHVRLTTIDPVTGSIVDLMRASGQDQPQLHDLGNLETKVMDPGYIQEIFIKPDILHVAIPARSHQAVTERRNSGETGSTDTVEDRARAARVHEYTPAGSSDGSSLGDIDDATEDGAGSCCESNSTAQRAFMRESQQVADSKQYSGRRPAHAESSAVAGSKDRATDEVGAKTEAEAHSRIPIRTSRRTTMGVGGSGTSTLGLNYSGSNIFPINGRAKGQQTSGAALGKGTSNVQPGSTSYRTKAQQPKAADRQPTKKAPTRIPVTSTARIVNKASSTTLARETKEPRSPIKEQASGASKRVPISKANTMSRATASNFLNPHLRRRSKSGVFEVPQTSGADDRGSELSPEAVGVSSGAATISAAATKVRAGMGRVGPERQYLNRPTYGADDERSGVLATSAAAGAAGRPRRMTHQATKLSIDPERARAAGAANIRNGPATATEAGANGRRFLRTPSNQDLPKSSSSEKESGEGSAGVSARGSTTYAGAHRPLQAKLETSGRTADVDRSRPAQRAGRPSIGGAGTRLPTWRTQQAVRESDERGSSGNSTPQRTSGSHGTSGSHPAGSGGAKQAVRESSTHDRSSDEAKERIGARTQKPVQARPAQGGRNVVASSSASAIGIGSYNATGYQTGRAPVRTGAAASVVGGVRPSQPSTAALQMQQQQANVRTQVASYQQRYGGPSSVVSAAAPVQQPTQNQYMAAKNSVAAPVQQPAQPQHVSGKSGGAAQAPQAGSAHSSGRASAAAGGVAALTPQEALARYGQQLSAAERVEILEFPHVYYTGTGRGRTAARAYDDERGDYVVQQHDHLLYRYEVLDVLGKGSFGQVLRARDHKTGEMAAVKIIRNRKRFHHQAQVEVKLLECLRRWDPSGAHHILQMTASFYFRSHLCIVMELLGMNMYEWLKAHQFAGTPAPLLRLFTVQMLQALQLMGRHRIIHADLKPENILLAGTPPMPGRRAGHPLTQPQLGTDMQRGLYAIKVIDLGSSCFETERVYTYIQSRFYRAPEVILGLPYGPGIDVWSLGCIVAELLTGYPLFPGENEREQLWCMLEVLGPPPAYMIERAPRCGDFADAAPYGASGVLPNGACVVGGAAIRPFTNSKNKRRRVGARPLDQILARARDARLVDFVLRALAWDPAVRLTPEDALRHPWITDAQVMMPTQPAYVVQPMQPGMVPPNMAQPNMVPHAAYMQQQQAYGNVARVRKA
ncbi:serine/threonine protein kinase, CMGC, dual-specificity [Coemansia sp. RSA 1972]|nr:serine/threonine protein kinase, CMGC, dual-specificity [Coemansia sp. RSA 1972]